MILVHGSGKIVRCGEVSVFGTPKTDLRRTHRVLRALFARADAIEREVAEVMRRAEAMKQSLTIRAKTGWRRSRKRSSTTQTMLGKTISSIFL
jgi:hypothetical protein